ncbi:hypothetical protein LY78DRAFT_323620 [Colletotrichum sublineola]|nr:hypothetical protein LY78DRAFT_323620 [Colletotrichum sublineola]
MSSAASEGVRYDAAYMAGLISMDGCEKACTRQWRRWIRCEDGLGAVTSTFRSFDYQQACFARRWPGPVNFKGKQKQKSVRDSSCTEMSTNCTRGRKFGLQATSSGSSSIQNREAVVLPQSSFPPIKIALGVCCVILGGRVYCLSHCICGNGFRNGSRFRACVIKFPFVNRFIPYHGG